MAFKSIQNFINKLTHTHRSSACTGPFGFVPQELLDLIISHLADDQVTLLACALVHPTWTRISRCHLPTVTLAISSPSRAKELTKLLRSSRETLSSSITGITLLGDVPFDDFPRSGQSPHARSYSKLLHTLKVKGTMLRSGVVENDPSLVRLFAQYFPDLTTLKVSCASYQDITSFMRALSGSFPRLAELSIELKPTGLDLPDTSLVGLSSLRLSALCLRTLRLRGWNNELVRWLGDNVVGTLEYLEMESGSVMSTCHIGEANSLIQGNKETLRDLRLIFAKREVAFDLSGLAHLRNLEVAGGMYETHLVFDGWKLPRSLSRVYLRNVLRVFPGLCHMRRWVGDDIDEGMVLQGAMLRGALGWEFDRP